MSTTFPEGAARAAKQRGFSMVTAVFLLVVLALLGAFLVRVASVQHATSALDVQSARAYQAARSGIEWGLYQVMDPANTVGGPAALPTCFGATPLTLQGTLSGFAVSVTCTRYPDNVTTYTELNRVVAVYDITAQASIGTAGETNYVERQLRATLTRCKDPSAAGPRFNCP